VRTHLSLRAAAATDNLGDRVAAIRLGQTTMDHEIAMHHFEFNIAEEGTLP
jgi:hypothetical protein